jgi:glycopeptide antibiotics resistance protein
MQNQPEDTIPQFSASGWSNRILLAAIAGILFLTLFPFRFALSTKLPANASPFLLGQSSKLDGPLDIFLNILLFVPFGFGLSEKLLERGRPRHLSFILTLLAGFLFSYGIEFLQIFIPARDSGWPDVLFNSVGTMAGFFLFEKWGRDVIRTLSKFEVLVTEQLTIRTGVLILAAYFFGSFAVSVHLQKKSLLTNWDPNTLLVVGNDAEAQYPWRGQILRLQFWARALPEYLASEVTSGGLSEDSQRDLIGDFEFSDPSLLRDRQRLFPDLVWAPSIPTDGVLNPLFLDGNHWLASKRTVDNFVNTVRKTNQFAVRVVCTPGEFGDGDKRIVSVSNSSGITNLTLRAEGTNLVFWFRNQLSVRRSLLAWYVPKVFGGIKRHDILFSYDGSNLSLFIDGSKEPRPYQLGPGTALAQLFVRVLPSELDGYRDLYYALIFLPPGVMMGLVARNARRQSIAAGALLAIAACLPPMVLEVLLISTSGSRWSVTNPIISLLLSITGILWINADRCTA